MFRSRNPSNLSSRLCAVRRFSAQLCLFLAAALALITPLGIRAQNYSWDARGVGMGGVTGLADANLAADLVAQERNYRSIVIPLGLMQVLSHLQVFDPNDPEFDVLRSVDYIGNPFHYSFNREKAGSPDLLTDIVDAELNRDLGVYRVFTPPEHLVAGGVLAPNWGYTFKFRRGVSHSFQGIYVGAGPYVSLQNEEHIDPRLIGIWQSVSMPVPANTTFYALNNASAQTAVAVTGGYRAKVGFSSSASDRDGVYVSANFNYLIGLHQDVADLNLQIETDSAGLVTLTPSQAPFVVQYLSSTSGKGFSVDLGMIVVRNGWEVGIGANHVGNRIDWTRHHRKDFTLTTLTSGADFVETSLPAPTGTIRKELPVEYVSNLGYSKGRWTMRTDWGYGLQKLSAHAGGEVRLGPLALRGGGRYGLKQLNPTGGIGLNVTRRFGIDVGVFGNSTNIEQHRNVAMAVSLRFERPTDQ